MYDLGSRLKEMRNKRGMTQKMLAAKINKSVTAVSGYESNIQTPPTDVLISIAEALRVPITYFVDVSSKDFYSAKGLTHEQQEFLDLLFQEFTTPSPASKELSARQIEIARRLFELFSNYE